MAEIRAQRRLAAILAADVVGYSRLMEHDEAGTLAAVRKLRADVIEPRLAEYQGRLFKTTGDGFLSEFPSVVNAVACAAAIQKAMAAGNTDQPEDRQIQLRIGVHLGDVISEGGDVYGDGVNVAARIEGLAPPGGVAVSAMVHDNVGSRLELTFEDMGEQQLKNIARPMRVYRLETAPRPAVRVVQPERTKPSIAVLPFTNMSSDAEQEYFADGISEDLITDLSKIAGLVVIARNSTFVYKGKAIDIRQVAKDLGVIYVIEGSVRRASSRVRVTVQLIDAGDGSHVWADRFDRNLEDVFAVQDEIVGKIVEALAGVIPTGPLPPKRRPPKIEAYDLFVRGRAQSLHLAAANRKARPLLEEACRIDPDFAEAHAWLAMNLHYGWMYCYEEDSRDQALVLSQRAVSLDPTNADAHVILGYLKIFANTPDLDGGREQFTTALTLNPNHADAWIFLADLETLEGRSEAALEAGRNAFRLNPYPPSYYHWLFGWVLFAAKRYAEVIDVVQHDDARALGSQRLLAGALAQLGRLEEAREAGRQFMREMPNFTIGSWVKSLPVRDLHQLDHFIEAYRAAGLPD
jgi:TolB-like protein/Tfp pilus assembly protein PilF